jgi:peptidoglycan hydrolase CwlO-like protein
MIFSKAKNITLFLEKSSKFILILGIFVFSFNIAYAQENTEQKKEELRKQLSEIEAQIQNYDSKIYKIKKEQNSLKKEVRVLDNQIYKQRLEVKVINLNLTETENEINEKKQEIIDLDEEINQKRTLLQEAILELDNYDKISWFEIILRGGNISDILGQIQSIYQLQKEVNIFIQNIDKLKENLEIEQNYLKDKKRDIERLQSLNSLQRVSLKRKKTEKNQLIKKTRGSEQRYKKLKKLSKKEIVTIKQQLYKLESVGISISFEEAYQKAKFSGEKTGIRPAFLLGIFQVESRMGTYIGGGNWQKDLYQCYINLGKRSRAEKEKNAFLKITSSLGLNPDSMPVSKKPNYGCGGAMGAAQFLPSTWLGYKNQITSLTGRNPPSPWNIEDAFVASSILLSNNGANTRTIAGERKAAAKYIAGSRWKRSVAQRYASQVLEWADFYQNQIDAINQ